MKARLIKDARIKHKAGEIVEVSPAEYNFLTSVGVAEPVKVEKNHKEGNAQKMNLLIGIPSTDFLHVEFVKSLHCLILRLIEDKIQFHVHFETGTLVYCARDTIASKAINEGYTHVLWLDSDMVFTDDLLDSLMFCDKPFVCGIFHSRRKGYHSALFKNLDINNLERFEDYPNTPFRVAGCGFAGVLIETEVLRQVMLKHGTCFLPLKMYGEDLAFCKRASEMGYEIWAEPTAVMGHVGHITIYPEDHEKWKAEISKKGS